ncbi:hypothetical protein V8F20_004122 [Naviculisporaceae sp. PSN 640]
MAIKNVAVVGASGNVGKPVTKGLIAAGFKVTAVARENSTSTQPEGVEVRKADFSSVESLTKALEGQDAVIITVASAAVGDQNPIIDAAIKAGVKRIIPSEFGHNPSKIKHQALNGLLVGKHKTIEYVIEQTKKNPATSWTGIATEPFFDWGLDAGLFGIDLQNKTIKIFDSGNQTVATSRLAFVADAVVAVLQREEETANKYISVAEFIVSQNQIKKILEEELGHEFQVIPVKTADLEAAGKSALEQHNYGAAFVPLLLAYNFGDNQGHGYTEKDAENVSLGLREINGADVKQAVRDWLKTRTA